jgi:hypothetical protein
MRRMILPAVLLLLPACTSIPLPRIDDGPRPALERKVVAFKREPMELVSFDGSSCFTTERRFQRVMRGQRIWCVWSYNGTYAAARRGPRVFGEP